MRNFRQNLERFFLRLQAKVGERIKVIRLTTYFLGLAFAVYSSAVVEKYIGLMNELHVPAQVVAMTRDMTRYFGYVVAIIIVVLVLQIIWVIADIVFGRKVPAPPPPDKEVKFTARPMEDHPNVEGLTGLAVDEFAGDTMRAEVVRGALESRSAIGLRIQNSTGQNVGFCDFYHLKRDAFQEWLEGKLYESKITLEHFEPIAEAEARNDAEINFFVGALLLSSGNQLHDFHLSPLVVSATRGHLRHKLSRFKTVNIYASIFSKSGRRYAELQSMKPFMLGTERGPAGGGHDVFLSSFHPSEPEDHYIAVSRSNVYTLALKP